MAKLTDLPAELHVNIAHKLWPSQMKLEYRPPEKQHIFALAMVSEYWADIVITVIQHHVRKEEQRLSMAKKAFWDSWDGGVIEYAYRNVRAVEESILILRWLEIPILETYLVMKRSNKNNGKS